MKNKITNSFVVGDLVTWETQRRFGREIRKECFNGTITAVTPSHVVVNYAPGKFRQVQVGTLNLQKVGA